MRVVRWGTFAGCALGILLADNVFAATYDLQEQWVNGANPNGPWSLVQGNTLLPYIRIWDVWGSWAGGIQPAYAPGPMTDYHPGDYLPGWFQASTNYGGQEDGSYKFTKGDIYVHTTDPANGAGNGPASALFVSPVTGTATISGEVFAAWLTDRPQEWQVTLNGAVLASGTDPDNGRFSWTHPAKFYLQNIVLNTGDIVALTIQRTGSLGVFMGADLKIVTQ